MRRRLRSLGAVATLWQVGTAVREHWLAVPGTKRARLVELIRLSRLRPSSLSRSQRRELRQLVEGLAVGGLVERLAAIALARRSRRSGRARRGR